MHNVKNLLRFVRIFNANIALQIKIILINIVLHQYHK